MAKANKKDSNKGSSERPNIIKLVNNAWGNLGSVANAAERAISGVIGGVFKGAKSSGRGKPSVRKAVATDKPKPTPKPKPKGGK